MKRMFSKKDSRMPEGRAGCKSVAASHRERQQEKHLRSLMFGGRAAQIGPVKPWAKIFAAHKTICCALDNRTVLRRNWPMLLDPLIDGRRSDPEQLGQSRLPTDDFARRCDWMTLHSHQHKASPYVLSIVIA